MAQNGQVASGPEIGGAQWGNSKIGPSRYFSTQTIISRPRNFLHSQCNQDSSNHFHFCKILKKCPINIQFFQEVLYWFNFQLAKWQLTSSHSIFFTTIFFCFTWLKSEVWQMIFFSFEFSKLYFLFWQCCSPSSSSTWLWSPSLLPLWHRTWMHTPPEGKCSNKERIGDKVDKENKGR